MKTPAMGNVPMRQVLGMGDGRIPSSHPIVYVVASSAVDLPIASTLAIYGIAMTPRALLVGRTLVRRAVLTPSWSLPKHRCSAVSIA